MGDDGAMSEPSPASGTGDQPGYRGAGSLDRLLRSFADDGQLVLLGLRPDGEIVFASKAVDYVFGHRADEILGTNILDWLHPDDVDRAAFTLGQGSEVGILPGITRFSVAHADGSWMPAEVLGSFVTDGEEKLIGVYARKGLHEVLTEEILQLLLTGAPRADALAPVTNSIQWEEGGSHLSISWCDRDGFNQVSTGLPDALGGGDGEDRTVWASARSDRVPRHGFSDDLDDRRRDLAAKVGVNSFWIEAVDWSDDYPPAIITVWTQGGPREPVIHAYGMSVARNLVELILRWTEQVQNLERAARLDSLTGLANRQAFFDTLAGAMGGGAVIYCDLNDFKPISDEFGHIVGDAILQLAGRRLQRSVRDLDMVARLGNDEFGVMCEGATPEEAEEIAGRIRAALAEPFAVGSQEFRISVGVGVASNPDELSERLLEAADRAVGQSESGRYRRKDDGLSGAPR
jgi:diguanylate cyclase (GGDEF)-like protein/PAS domain S-box-containing protein